MSSGNPPGVPLEYFPELLFGNTPWVPSENPPEVPRGKPSEVPSGNLTEVLLEKNRPKIENV